MQKKLICQTLGIHYSMCTAYDCCEKEYVPWEFINRCVQHMIVVRKNMYYISIVIVLVHGQLLTGHLLTLTVICLMVAHPDNYSPDSCSPRQLLVGQLPTLTVAHPDSCSAG